MNTQNNFARTEFAAAINQICAERNISPEIVINAVKEALLASFTKDFPIEAEKIAQDEKVVKVDLDVESGEFKLYAGKEEDKISQMTEVTPPGFGRIAAQTAKGVIIQQIREAERTGIITEYEARLGEIVTGMVQRMDGKNVIVDIGRGQGIMPPEEQVKTEYYRLNSRISVLISDIRETYKGKAIIVSRSDPRLVSALFAREVPEVGSGAVVVKAIAREAGNRTKIAVLSTQEGVDPVGSCVGQKGVRVQAVINELNGEKIDIIQFSEDKEKFLRSAIAPAETTKVEFSKDQLEVTVTVPHDQLSLAIGRGGTNVKLAAKLLKIRIKVISEQADLGIVVTGEEEFEIDQLSLSPEIRAILVENNITRIDDLGYSMEKISQLKSIKPEDLELIKSKLAIFQPGTVAKTEDETKN